MGQATTQVPMACGKLEISTDSCSTWTDISGEAQSVSGTEQTRMSGEAYTLTGDTALVAGGKKEPMELVFAIVYTEDDDDAYELVREHFETTGCGGDFCARWSPRGGEAGHERITTGEGILVNFTYPPMDASAGGPIMGGFTLKVGSVSTAIIAS
ncbi:MAG: hypothetical protein JSV86_06960 [Gemmatimonadota bacterium]|nr:MAG: hypothetical protein JSV86_06960 [Gemmatimonadota bacterium]